MRQEKNRGVISYLILIIIALALLKYFFNWSIFDAVASNQGQKTMAYIQDILKVVWTYTDMLIYSLSSIVQKFL